MMRSNFSTSLASESAALQPISSAAAKSLALPVGRAPARYDVSGSYSPLCAADARPGGLRPSGDTGPKTPLLLPPPVSLGEPLVLRSPQAGERLLSAPLRIGRGVDNDWVLQDSHASRQHVSLQPLPEGVRIRDRGSKNGTFVNGVRVVEGLLPLGGRLTIGQTDFRLALPASATGTSELIGDSPAMAKVRQQVQTFANTELPVLVLGESGTGKELVARALHTGSGRRGALVAINCGALPRELIESELFGHERGAFTGAQRRHLGCFGEADGGTLFLDEIGELPLELQPRLLRALESRSIRPVGAAKEIAVNVRIVAATHRDLEQAVQQGRFRADLYYRLCGFEIVIPPLRERQEDIPKLVQHFLQHSADQGLLPPCRLRQDDLDALLRYPWPGNVRELRAAVLRAAHLAGPLLSATDIVPIERRGAASPVSAESASVPLRAEPSEPATSAGSFAAIEKQAYLQALAQAGGSCRGAAELLQVPKSTLHDKLRRLGIRTSRTQSGKSLASA